MRTTLNIDPDVLEAAKEISSRTRRSAGRVLSDLARQALSAESPPLDSQGPVVNGFETLPVGGRVVTPEWVAKLIEDSAS